MIRIIVTENENGRCYTFEIIDNIFCLFGLNKCVKNRLLAKEKEIKKVWNEGTKLTANNVTAEPFRHRTHSLNVFITDITNIINISRRIIFDFIALLF